MLSLLFATILAAQEPPALLFIGIDGLRPDYVLEADRHGLAIPNLRRFLVEGAHAASVIGVTPAVTYPSFTTLITGRAPAGHGVVANQTFDPFGRNLNGWYWYAEDVTSESLWDVAAAAGRTVGNVHWPVSVGARVTWNLPQLWRTGTPDDRKLLRALETPGLERELEEQVKQPYADGIDETLPGDVTRGLYAAALIDRRRPRLMTVYLTALEHEQHDKGPLTPEAFAVLERIDAIVGSLLESARKAYGTRVVVAVASDHGFAATNREVNLTAALNEAGLITYENGQVIDWKAVTWGAGGSVAIMLRDSTDGATREAVRQLLTRLAANPDNGISKLVDAVELRRRGAFPGAAWAVEFTPGYRQGGATTGPLITNGAKAGTHGYFNDRLEMRSAFFVMGPGVEPGRNLGDIDMKDIAPSLARLVGLELRKAEGLPLW
jgi:predicted AlkP superfamily pyrophosphatase or phosphodiesterase